MLQEDQTVSVGQFFDVNALYPSVLTGKLPLRHFRLLEKHDPGSHEEFSMLESKLRRADVKFFQDASHTINKGYAFKITIGYDLNDHQTILRNIDLASFPTKRVIASRDLSESQQETASRLGRNISNEPQKLVSDCPGEMLITDFSESILYLILFHHAKILKVHAITSFTEFDYARVYMSGIFFAQSFILKKKTMI